MAHPVVTHIASLIGSFLTLDYGTAQATALGSVVPSADSSRIVLKPHDGRASFLILQHDDLDGAKGFLSSIEFSWPSGVRLSENDLTEAFGPFRVMKALRPPIPDTFLFGLRGRPLVGQVVVPVQSRDRDGTLEVTSIIIRRFPPDPYRIQEGKAVRIIVLADLGATEFRPDPWPQPAWIWKLADLDALMQMMRPAIHFDVENKLEPGRPPLHVTFRPTSIAAFHPNTLPRHFAPTAELVNLADGLFELRQKKINAEKLRKSLDMNAIPARFRSELETALDSKPVRPGDLIRSIDAALSDQMNAIFAEPRFQAFQSAWLGLQYLAECLDPADGSRIEVHSTSRSGQIETFIEGVLEDELNHPSGAPPAFVVVDGNYSANATDIEHLGRIATEAARIQAPVLFGVSSTAESFEPSAWARLVSHSQSKFLIGAYPRVLLRADIAADPEIMRCFRYLPSRTGRPVTAVMGSGAWALAALAARSQAERGHLTDAAIGAPAPLMLRGRKHETPDVFETLPGNRRPANGSDPLTSLALDESARRVVPGASVRSLAWKPAPGDAATAILVKAPILGMLRRLENQTPRSTEPFAIRQMILAAARARISDAEVNLDMDPTPGWPKTIRLKITPPFPVDGETKTLSIEMVWKAPPTAP